jgi:hypothetical protein
MSERTRILVGLAAEVLFAVLPLVAVLLVLIHVGHAKKLLWSPEWSFGASILFGQALVKFICGLARGGAAATGPVGFAVALLVVFGLVPSLLVLTMTLQATETAQSPASWLQWSQLVFFVIGSLVYILLGTVGEEWHRKAHTHEPH